ncbi:MAG: TIGR02186 family protein [Pseudomonadota bacterium]
MGRLASLLALAMVLCAVPVGAQKIVADLSQARVSIDANFDGSEIVVFGAIKPDVGADPNLAPVEVIVTVSGPLRPVTVRKKDRVALIWVNTVAVDVDLAPTLYKVATSAPLSDILFDVEDLRHSITTSRAIRSVGAEIERSEDFTDALIRIREAEGLYQVQEGAVQLTDQALFRTTIALPANLVEGDYNTRIFLTRDKKVVAEYTRILDVRKVGLERFIYTLAHEQPLVYGVLSLAIAIAAGWGASALFRYLRG